MKYVDIIAEFLKVEGIKKHHLILENKLDALIKYYKTLLTKTDQLSFTRILF